METMTRFTSHDAAYLVERITDYIDETKIVLKDKAVTKKFIRGPVEVDLTLTHNHKTVRCVNHDTKEIIVRSGMFPYPYTFRAVVSGVLNYWSTDSDISVIFTTSWTHRTLTGYIITNETYLRLEIRPDLITLAEIFKFMDTKIKDTNDRWAVAKKIQHQYTTFKDAVERRYNSVDALASEIPGIHQLVVNPATGLQQSLFETIIDLNDCQGWDRNKVADWIETLDNVPVFEERVNLDDQTLSPLTILAERQRFLPCQFKDGE